MAQPNSLGDFVISIAFPIIVGFKPTELMPEVSCLCIATGTSREAAQDDIPLPPITSKHEAIYLMKMYCKLITVSRGISPWVVLPFLVSWSVRHCLQDWRDVMFEWRTLQHVPSGGRYCALKVF